MAVGQSRSHSLIEAGLNVLVGFGVSVAAQMLIFPIFGIHVAFKENIEISLFFTVISIARSYCLRRFFNWVHHRG